MIYVELEEWEAIMRLVKENPAFEVIYNYHLGSLHISDWYLKIWAFNRWGCYSYYTSAGQMLLSLGVIKDLQEIWPTGPADQIKAYTETERNLSERWRGPTEKAMEALDLATLGEVGSVHVPREVVEY